MPEMYFLPEVLVFGDVLGGGLLQRHHGGLSDLLPVHRGSLLQALHVLGRRVGETGCRDGLGRRTGERAYLLHSSRLAGPVLIEGMQKPRPR